MRDSVARKRFIVEIGTGADLHGGDVSKAAQRAIRDAVSRSCLCGLFDIIGITDPNEMYIEVKVACPNPERINREEVLKAVPFGSTCLEVVPGGLAVRGLELLELGEGDTIVVAVAALTVYVDVKD
ncbi:Lin0512 family protein [Thermacetogenium phaeum]|uniref:Lin0512 family protein n=1 Tax=Thermacetogenium phaeum TaxID=85874 RepID=UPI00191C1736|nr:Lin0512 family protein [Thermacetogenium phaeum]